MRVALPSKPIRPRAAETGILIRRTAAFRSGQALTRDALNHILKIRGVAVLSRPAESSRSCAME